MNKRADNGIEEGKGGKIKIEIIEPKLTDELRKEIQITEERLKSRVNARFNGLLDLEKDSNSSRWLSAIAEQIVYTKYSQIKGIKYNGTQNRN